MRRLGLGRAWVVCALLIANLNCSGNLFTTFADTSTNDALYQDAIIKVDQGNYNGALSDIGSMTGSYPSQPQVLELQASAYAGLCGFNFLNFAQAFSGLGSTLLFPFLLAQFPTTNGAAIDDCSTAINIIESIGPIGSRTTDQNTFLALVSLAKIGVILSFYDGNGTATVNTGYDACTSGATRTQGGNMTDADAAQIGTGITVAAANLAAIASAVKLGSGSLTSINTLCGQVPGGAALCAITDPTAFTAPELLAIRSMVKENSVIGLGITVANGTTCPGNVTQCFCP